MSECKYTERNSNVKDAINRYDYNILVNNVNMYIIILMGITGKSKHAQKFSVLKLFLKHISQYFTSFLFLVVLR